MAFASQLQVQPPTVVAPGVRLSVIAASFNGTNPTLTVASPVSNVMAISVRAAPPQLVSGTTYDIIRVNNSLNASGFYTMIANSTNGSDVIAPSGITLTRTGTSSQDIVVEILSKG